MTFSIGFLSKICRRPERPRKRRRSRQYPTWRSRNGLSGLDQTPKAPKPPQKKQTILVEAGLAGEIRFPIPKSGLPIAESTSELLTFEDWTRRKIDKPGHPH